MHTAQKWESSNQPAKVIDGDDRPGTAEPKALFPEHRHFCWIHLEGIGSLWVEEQGAEVDEVMIGPGDTGLGSLAWRTGGKLEGSPCHPGKVFLQGASSVLCVGYGSHAGSFSGSWGA